MKGIFSQFRSSRLIVFFLITDFLHKCPNWNPQHHFVIVDGSSSCINFHSSGSLFSGRIVMVYAIYAYSFDTEHRSTHAIAIHIHISWFYEITLRQVFFFANCITVNIESSNGNIYSAYIYVYGINCGMLFREWFTHVQSLIRDILHTYRVWEREGEIGERMKARQSESGRKGGKKIQRVYK